MLFGLGQVMRHDLGAHFLRGDLWHPAELMLGFAGVAQQGFNFCGAKVAGVDAVDGCLLARASDDGVGHLIDAVAFPTQLQAQGGGGPFNELAHAVAKQQEYRRTV